MEQLKLLLGITDSDQDKLLQFIFDEAVCEILSYCRLQSLPEQLAGTAARLAADIWNSEYKKGKIKTISEGERSITYDIPSPHINSGLRSILNPFINRKGRVPDDLE